MTPTAMESHASYSSLLKRMAYSFDGKGTFHSKPWDLGRQEEGRGDDDENFSWYHVELPRSYTTLASAAQYLIESLCPPLKLQDILALASNGPFCAYVDGALIFRVNSAGPTISEYTHKLAGRVTEDCVITVSLGSIPRLKFSSSLKASFLSEIPRLEGSGCSGDADVVIQEHVLEFYLSRNYLEHPEHCIPTSILGLVVHIIDTHVDHLQDRLTKIEMDIDERERDLDIGGYTLKQQLLVDRLFPKMHLKLQRLLQVISHGEQVFPRFKEKCANKSWSSAEDMAALQALVGRLQKLRENIELLANRITALQSGLDTWQSEQINRKLYYLSFLSIIFLPLSIVTSAFGMNVGGLPWTDQQNPAIKDGFRNVMILCAVILLVLLLCFSAAQFCKHVKQFSRLKLTLSGVHQIRPPHAGYTRL